jgi:DNA-directed RNA polymerase specialized sigma24 family protein
MSSIGGAGGPVGRDAGADDELARLVAQGDEAAFAAVYGRYFARIYDFALRVSRDREIAALVVQATFLRVYQALRAGQTEAPVRLQLFAGAHHDLAERLRYRRGPPPESEEPFAAAHASVLPNPALAGELPELARLAWLVCGEIKLDEYELLDLDVRQQLDPGEIAVIHRSRPETVEQRLARLRAAFDDSFAARLVLSRGRRTCLDLDFLAGDEQWSAGLRRRVVRHLQSCLTCQGTRDRYPSGTALLAAFVPVPAPAGWEETILTRLQEAARSGALAQAPAPPAVAPPPPRRPREPLPQPAAAGPTVAELVQGLFAGGGARGPLIAVLGGGLLVLAIILGTLCAAGAFDGGTSFSETATPTRTRTPSATPTASLTRTPTLTPTSPPLPTDTPVPTATAEPPPPTATPPADGD